ncbi:MAG: hypothetical protein PHS41_12690 [Victivallaceae bacterium]|nr:hypothetical protein [Victivallaceae bacterium]
MIGMSFADALFGILALWLLFLAILWLRELNRIRNFEWHLSNSRLFHCDQCHHSFIIKEPLNLCRCPRCNAICISRNRRNLE